MQAVDIELLRQVAILVVNEVELQQLGQHLGLPTDGTLQPCLSPSGGADRKFRRSHPRG